MNKILTIIALIMASVTVMMGQNARLETRQWKLTQLEGIRVLEPSSAYLELDAAGTRFTGNAGCNRMFGAVDIQGRRIDFSNIGTTRMACADSRVVRTETLFVKALENADRFRLQGNSLELYDRNRMVARLTAPTKQRPQDSVGLEDRKWMLEAIKGVPVSKAGRGAFAVFDPKKTSVGGNSNCNVFGGNYKTVGQTLKITGIISTMRACEEDDRMTIEREFLDGLQRADRFEIERGKLKLYRNDRLLLTFEGEPK